MEGKCFVLFFFQKESLLRHICIRALTKIAGKAFGGGIAQNVKTILFVASYVVIFVLFFWNHCFLH